MQRHIRDCNYSAVAGVLGLVSVEACAAAAPPEDTRDLPVRVGRETEFGEPQPKLMFKQVGKDLVVGMTIEIPDAPHLVWTHAELVLDHDPYLEGPRRPPKLDRVQLSYHVIQCRDDPVILHMRHRKKRLEVSWRLIDHKKAGVRYHVVDRFNPSAAELTELAPKLVKISEETRQRARLAVP